MPTNQIYLEIMPSGISKAAGMEELCHILNENIKTIVIGDYYNDLEIMKKRAIPWLWPMRRPK